MEAKLYVGNLSYTTTIDELKTLFTKAGKVESVVLISDQYTNRSKGYGFVEMSSQVQAENAISLLHGFSLNGRDLKVNIAKPKARPDRKSDLSLIHI